MMEHVIRVRGTNYLWPMIAGRPAWVGKDKRAAQGKLCRVITQSVRHKYEIVPLAEARPELTQAPAPATVLCD